MQDVEVVIDRSEKNEGEFAESTFQGLDPGNALTSVKDHDHLKHHRTLPPTFSASQCQKRPGMYLQTTPRTLTMTVAVCEVL
jgi:hypothetical protein